MSPAKAFRLATAEVLRKNPGLTGSDLDEAVDELMCDWAAEAAHDREAFGDPDDTPYLEPGRDNCDDWGTGEGRFHGRV
jgi:hypothetical protein